MINRQMKLLRLDSLLNIMERELDDFLETCNSAAVPYRIDDLHAILASVRGIVTDILEPAKPEVIK